MSDPISRLWRRVLLTVGRGRVRTVNDGGQVQKMQVKAGDDETIDDLPRLAEYGFQSVPPEGSNVVIVFVAGERSNGVAIASGHQTFRMRGLASGEVAISDDKGQSVYLSAAGIRIDGGGLPIEITNTPSVSIDSPAVSMTGDLHVEGSILTDADVTAAGNITAVGSVGDAGGSKTMALMRSEYNLHRHSGSATPTPLM